MIKLLNSNQAIQLVNIGQTWRDVPLALPLELFQAMIVSL